MLLRTRSGEQEVRGNPFASADRIPAWSGAFSQWSGTHVALENVAGLPAVGAAIRLIAETIAMIPLQVYEGDLLERAKARDSWQWGLLHDAPNTDDSAFNLMQDIATSIETTGDAFVFKLKMSADRVEQLIVLDPNLVEVRRNNANRKVFDVTIGPDRTGAGRTETFTSATILHIRGWSLTPGADTGTSPIALHREALGSQLALHQFEGRFFRNNARPGGVIEVPGDVTPDKLNKAREIWEESHRGPENINRIGVLAFGAKYRDVGLSLKDAQFVEAKGFSVEEIARMFRVDPALLGEVVEGQRPQVSELFDRFLKLDLAPRLRRIEMALASDPDLFPSDGDLFPEFLTDAVLRPDAKTRYEAYRLARQGGWLAPNEIREKENLPPKDGGDEIQQTPVGGAPNEGGNSSEGQQDGGQPSQGGS